MSKATEAQQGDSNIRTGEQADHPRANHQQCAHGDNHFTRNNQVNAEPTLEQRRQITTQYAAYVSKQHWHPCKHSDFFQVKAIHFEHEQWDPGVESTPGWFCQETRQCDTPEATGLNNLPRRHFLTVVGLVLCFLTTNDVIAFFVS